MAARSNRGKPLQDVNFVNTLEYVSGDSGGSEDEYLDQDDADFIEQMKRNPIRLRRNSDSDSADSEIESDSEMLITKRGRKDECLTGKQQKQQGQDHSRDRGLEPAAAEAADSADASTSMPEAETASPTNLTKPKARRMQRQQRKHNQNESAADEPRTPEAKRRREAPTEPKRLLFVDIEINTNDRTAVCIIQLAAILCNLDGTEIAFFDR
jgi:hypothetical protein